jgi:hypothetical protein
MVDNKHPLRVRLEIGRKHLTTFFAELEKERKRLGEGSLEAYCYNELSISLSTLDKMASLFDKVDKKIIRENQIIPEKEIAKNKKIAAREQKRKEILERKRARYVEIIEKAEKKKYETQILLDSLQKDPEPQGVSHGSAEEYSGKIQNSR